MKARRFVIGVDLGGTEIKFSKVSYDDDGGLGDSEAEWKCMTHDGAFVDGVPRFAVSIKSAIDDVVQGMGENEGLAGIGIAAPGLPDRNNSCIEFMPGRLHGLPGFQWGSYLGVSCGVTVINDGQAALLGEIWKGGAEGVQDAVLLTIGTGVGGAIFSNGKILKGAIGRAGHLGHISVDFRGSGDICGTPGSLEDAIGQATLPARSYNRIQTFSQLAELVLSQNDTEAQSIWSTMLDSLGASLSGIINILDPELIVLGGGLVQTGLPLLEDLSSRMDHYEWRPNGHKVPIILASLGQDAGASGAAFAAIHPSHL